MDPILLAKSTTPIIGQVAWILGIVMDLLFKFTSSFGVTNIGLSIILFTVIINLLMWPLTVSQQKSSRLMSVMQPELQAIQKKYKNRTDQASVMKMQAETKAVYDKYGTSMTGSCLFLLIQMPILFALYQVIYRIPAYVPTVSQVFERVAAPLMQQGNYVALVNEIAPNMRPALAEGAAMDAVVDFLYKFTPAQWEQLKTVFPALNDAISGALPEIERMNYFLGVNLSTPPFQGWMPNLAWVIPFAAAAVQWYSAKLMTASNPNSRASSSSQTEENPMAQQMKTMNTMMPLMSLFFCFTLPAGIGVYWVASGLCRMIQQIIVNHQLGKMDVDELVKKNLEKANQKAIKEGRNPQELKSRTDKLLRDVKNAEKKAENEEAAMEKKMALTARHVKDSTEYYNRNAKPGSLAAKANMVAMFNERQAEQKRGKKKQAEAAPAEAAPAETVSAETVTAETVATEAAAAEAAPAPQTESQNSAAAEAANSTEQES